jgi:pyrimidine-nucleoside phosphorylase
MKKEADAIHLAELMVETGERMGKRVAALITDMDQPLGYAVGNALEIIECIELLRGETRNPERTALSADLLELSIELSAWMFYLADRVSGVEAGRALAHNMITSGKALEKFREMLRLQGGGDVSVVDKPSRLPHAQNTIDVKSKLAGFVTAMQCEQVGTASLMLGGGRSKKEDMIDPAVGIVLQKKVGHQVKSGETLCTIHYNAHAESKLPEAMQLLAASYSFAPVASTTARPLIHGVIGGKK